VSAIGSTGFEHHGNQEMIEELHLKRLHPVVMSRVEDDNGCKCGAIKRNPVTSLKQIQSSPQQKK